MLNAARLYISVGNPLFLSVGQDGNPIPPQSANPKDLNYKTPWDFFEITYVPQEGTEGLFNINLSNVQSANIPLAFVVAGEDPSTKTLVNYTRGWAKGGYAKFIAKIRVLKDFSGLCLGNDRVDRVIAPGTAITAFKQNVTPELFPKDYLAGYINQVWSKFSTEDLTFVGDPPPESNSFVTWKGRVTNGQFIFTTDQLGLEPIVLDKPTTADLFENNFLFCASGGGSPGSLQENYALQLFGTLCAAFNRSMMLTTDELANSSNCKWCRDSEQFYKDLTTNHYARLVHENTLGGLAYAFQSDDHCDVSSYVSVVNPSDFKIILGE